MVLISELNSHTVVKISLINSIMVLFRNILILRGKVLLTIPSFFFSCLIIVEVLRVVLIASLESHTLVEFTLIERSVLLIGLWLFLLSHKSLELLLGGSNSLLPV